MYKKTITLVALALIAGSTAFSNTPLITNTTFDTFDGWIFGSNRFQPKATWIEFVEAPEAYAYEDRLSVDGGGEYTYNSWDDGVADKIESFMFHEFGAGPVGSGTDSEFNTGDVIRFKGTARATRTGADTADMVVQAYIKVLGYNELRWDNQVKPEYSDFYDITSTDGTFDLMITFPDLAVDDSLQRVQIGFGIVGEFNLGDSVLDTGTITFSGIEAYVEGTGATTWAGYDVDGLGYADTTPWIGYVNVLGAPWVWSVGLNNWMYLPEENVSEAGAWTYILAP